MKGAEVYHQIKALRQRYSLRECARQLDISVNTVKKYDEMSLEEASSYLAHCRRRSQFDEAVDFIVEQLDLFPRISAVKLLRKVKKKYPSIRAGERMLRRYIAPLRRQRTSQKFRYFEPVIDMEPGIQVQVDIGEAFVYKANNDSKLKVYFVCFVFSYSRMGYVYFQGVPFNTESFIKAHRCAFDYFGGIAKEYVYDQSKLVVIEERYREVLFNERFHQFALRYGFSPRICEGYDPQSKGKVERSIRYVKESFLYGDYFSDLEDVRQRSLLWLEEVANCRIHAITKREPVKMFEEETAFLSKRHELLQDPLQRWADKTGLFNFDGNKYSVPHSYQRHYVGVIQKEDTLIISDLDSGEQIAIHQIPPGKGHIIKNNNHYRDYRKSVATLTVEVQNLFEELEEGAQLVSRVKADNPFIARDQLRGLAILHKKYGLNLWQRAMPTLMNLPHLRVTLIESVLSSYRERERLAAIDADLAEPVEAQKSSLLDRSLDCYMEVLNHA